MRFKLEKENVGKILEILYFCILICFIIWSFLNTTKFEIIWPTYLYQDLKSLLLLIILLKAAYLGNYNKIELCIITIISVAILFSINRTGDTELELLLLIIIGAKEVSLKKITKVYFIVTTLLLIFTIFSALTGRIENLIYIQEGRRNRMALGIGYPTDFSAYVFYDVLCYIYIRGKKIKYLELIGIIILGFGVYWITDARLNTLCILMTACVFIYNKFRNNVANKNQKEYIMNKYWTILLAISPVVCAAFMIIGSILYSSGNKIIAMLDQILNYRFYQGNKAIEIFKFTLWGQNIPMQGYGGVTEKPEHYFFLDSSYLSIVMQYGLLILGIILFIWILISFRARKEKNGVLLWIITIISIQCMVEHHMLEIAYNPFLWAVFARTSVNDNDIGSEKFFFNKRNKKIRGKIYDK